MLRQYFVVPLANFPFADEVKRVKALVDIVIVKMSTNYQMLKY